MNKSITPVVSIILLILITIGASVAAFFFINSSVSDLQSGSQLDLFPGLDNSKLTLVSIKGSSAIVRNDGSSPVTELIMFVNGEMLNYDITDNPILPGQIREINYNPRLENEPLEIKVLYNRGKQTVQTSPASINTAAAGFTNETIPLNSPEEGGEDGPFSCPGGVEMVNFENNENFSESNDLACGCGSGHSSQINALINPGFEEGELMWNLNENANITSLFSSSGSNSLNLSMPSTFLTVNPMPSYGFQGVFGVADYLSFDGYMSSLNEGNYSYIATVRYATLDSESNIILGPNQISFGIYFSPDLMGMCNKFLNESTPVYYIDCLRISELKDGWFNHKISGIQSQFIANFSGIDLDDYNITLVQIQSAIHPANVNSSVTAYVDNIFTNATGQGYYCDADADMIADGKCNEGACEIGYCGDDVCNSWENSTECSQDCEVPFYFEELTVKCLGVDVGETFELNGSTYLAVNDSTIGDALNAGTRICTTHVTTMSGTPSFGAFVPASYYTTYGINISDWDVSNVKDMQQMFRSALNFNQYIGNWDVSNVTNMYLMFFYASSFNQPIGNWNVSNVINMQQMFNSASSFNQSIGNWDISNLITMSGMFAGQNFAYDIGNWDVSKVTDMSYMFSGNNNFNQNISGWDVSNVTTMRGMFSNAHNFNQNIGSWDTSNVINIQEMFSNAFNFNKPIGDWNTSNVILTSYMFFNASSFNQSLANWDVSNVNNMGNMFNEALSFNQNISNWDVSSVTFCDWIFVNCPINELYKPAFTSCTP